jgi:hypothetical protein
VWLLRRLLLFLRRFRPGVTAPTKPSHITVSLPAPVGGINYADPVPALPPTDALVVDGMYPASNGLATMYGSRRWSTAASSGPTVPARTLVSFVAGTAADSRLFCCSRDGIYDVTTSGSGPTRSLAFSTATGEAGFASYCQVTTIAGEFGLLCDEANGLHLYTQSTDSWSVVASGAGAGEIDGATTSDLVFVMQWKNRVWFVRRNSATCCYLPPGQITGTVTDFNFGSRLRKGGAVAGLWSMTVDGGSGVDDFLVVISTAGELLLWEGTDPDTADAFNLIGSWDLGSVPYGRSFAYNYAGDVLVPTAGGIISVSRIRSGFGINQAAGMTRKIQPYFGASWIQTIFAWDSTSDRRVFMFEHPQQRGLSLAGGPFMSSDSGAWFDAGFTYLSSAVHAVNHLGTVYFTRNDDVYRSVSGNDGQLSDGSGGVALEWTWRSGRILPDATRHKVITQARCRFGTAPTSYCVSSAYDPNVPLATTAPTSGASSTAWSGVSPVPGEATEGQEAYIIVRGTGACTLMGADVQIQLGGDA